tara:strand:- start:53 stop:691 length:639 start_codon:yes stop_codon:yes gene_type:complete
MSTIKLPLINRDFISEIWNELCHSNMIVNDYNEFKDYDKEKLISYKINNRDYENILYLAHCDLLKNNEYLSFGCSIIASTRIGNHLRMSNTQKKRYLEIDYAVLKMCNTYPKEYVLKRKLKLFFKSHCCYQILSINKDQINKCIDTHHNKEERKLYNQYWGFDNFEAREIKKSKKITYVEYIEKPIEDMFLRQNGLLRHTDGTKEEVKKNNF